MITGIDAAKEIRLGASGEFLKHLLNAFSEATAVQNANARRQQIANV